jgi:hypothetical protein
MQDEPEVVLEPQRDALAEPTQAQDAPAPRAGEWLYSVLEQ